MLRALASTGLNRCRPKTAQRRDACTSRGTKASPKFDLEPYLFSRVWDTDCAGARRTRDVGAFIMHMADALLSPVIGGAMWLGSGAAIAAASRHLRRRADDALVPLMGMLGAFVFAAQMINFSIPATGSSGHLGGALLLAILLGPHAAFLVIASVLTVQALFFADGGLLALGANMFNLGVLPCFVAYPLVYRPLAGPAPTPRRSAVAAVCAAVVGLQLGALGVVLQTVASGISSLPLQGFLVVMLPIHAAIGVVEGLATAALLLFLHRTRPELLTAAPEIAAPQRRPLLRRLALATLFTGGVLSWFSSTQPDGLEWSVARAAGTQALPAPRAGVHAALDEVQHRIAVLPGYSFPDALPAAFPAAFPAATPAPAPGFEAGPPKAPQSRLPPKPPAWPDVNRGTSLSGVLGGLVTVALVAAIGLGLRWRRRLN